MDHEQKYKEALSRASKLMVQNPFDTVGQMVEYIFPELKESEDEKIKKEIIAIFKGKIPYTSEEDAKRYIDWLEKQDVNREYVFRPLVGTTIEKAVKQAMEQGDVVLAFNGFYTPVNGKTSDKILTEYDHWLEKQSKQKQQWEPNAAQLIVIKDLIEDKNTSKVNKVILRGMFDEVKQFTNNHKREVDDAYLQGICNAKYEIEKQGKKLDAAEVIEWLDEHVPTKFEDMQNYVQQFKQDFGL